MAFYFCSEVEKKNNKERGGGGCPSNEFPQNSNCLLACLPSVYLFVCEFELSISNSLIIQNPKTKEIMDRGIYNL